MSVPESSQKAAVSVLEMALLCQLSRSRFNALVKEGVFPRPVQQGEGKRPHYTQELIQRCLEIRRTGIGLNGRIVLFNRRPKKKGEGKRAPATTPLAGERADLIESLRSLGMTATAEAVNTAVQILFPTGTAGLDPGEVIRKVFLHLQGRKP